MRSKHPSSKKPAEQVVKDMRRATRRRELVVDKFSEIVNKAEDFAPTLREEFRGTVADTVLLDDVVGYIAEQAEIFT